MTLFLSFALSTAGFMSLALAMDRHHQPLWHQPPTAGRRWGLRSSGAAMLVGALLICVRASGWSTGFVEWLGLLSASAICVVLALTYLTHPVRARFKRAPARKPRGLTPGPS